MGKYPNSEIHNKYSDWHWELVKIDDKYRRLYVADVDRLWIEYDFKLRKVIAIIDIKWDNSGDGMTTTEAAIYEWFESVGAYYYIVYIDRSFTVFRVVNCRGLEKEFTGIEYADWLLSLRTSDYNIFNDLF